MQNTLQPAIQFGKTYEIGSVKVNGKETTDPQMQTEAFYPLMSICNRWDSMYMPGYSQQLSDTYEFKPHIEAVGEIAQKTLDWLLANDKDYAQARSGHVVYDAESGKTFFVTGWDAFDIRKATEQAVSKLRPMFEKVGLKAPLQLAETETHYQGELDQAISKALEAEKKSTTKVNIELVDNPMTNHLETRPYEVSNISFVG